MTQRDRDIKVPIGDLLDEYFRLRQTIHLLRESLILPYVAERNNPGIKKKLLVAGSARLRIEVGKLLTGSAIDKKSFVNKISDAFKEQVWDNSTIENLEKTLIARCKAIETEASNVPPSVDKSRVCLAKSWNHSFEDLDGINLFRSSISADHPNVNTLLNELRADTIPSPALGTEDINSLSRYIFVEHFGGGEVKAQQLARETELGFRRSLQTFASEIEEWRNEHLPVDVLPAARLLWYIRRSPSLTRALGSESAKLAGLLASLQDLDGAWRLPAGFRHAAQEDETAEATALCLVCLLRFVGSSRYRGQIEKAAVWLCNAQRRDGAWRTDGRISHEREADILTTATAREGLASSGLQEARGHVNRADAFLLRASTLSGGGYKDPGGLASSLR